MLKIGEIEKILNQDSINKEKIHNKNQEEEDNFNDFYSTTQKALKVYEENEGSWNLLIKNAMEYDSGWTFKIIERYNKIYNLL